MLLGPAKGDENKPTEEQKTKFKESITVLSKSIAGQDVSQPEDA